MAEKLLEANDVSVDFRINDQYLKAISGINLTIGRGKVLALVGESGSGKSTFATSIMGLHNPEYTKVSGSIKVAGKELVGLSEKEFDNYRGVSVGMIFQDPLSSLNPLMKIGDQIAEAITVHDKNNPEVKNRVRTLLNDVGIDEEKRVADQYPHQLSGGMRQRVMIAIALANEPDLIIADEPTTALDAIIQAQILELIKDIQRKKDAGVLLITHNLDVVSELADDVAVMYAGQIVEKGYASTGSYASQYYEAYFNLGHYDKEKKTNVQDRDTPLQDVNVRKAVGYAMNTGDIAKKYSNGFLEATNTIVSKSDLKKDFYNKSVKGYNSKSSGDPEKAGEYLKKAGYKKESDGYYYKDGKKLTITFMARSGKTTAEAEAKAYIAAWKAAGIDAKLYQDKLIDFATWTSIMTTGTNQDWDVTIAGWSEGTVPSFGQLWATSAKYNMGHVVSDKVAKNLSDTDSASSDTAMIQDIKDFQKTVVDDNAYVIPTTSVISASLVNGRVTGFTTANVNDIYAQLGVSSNSPTTSGNPRK